MNKYQKKYREYREANQNEGQRSFEFVEYPQVQEYYSNQMNLGHKKPKKIIVTEIYDEIIPKSKNDMQRKEYFNYYTQSSPSNNFQRCNNFGQKKLFTQNRNFYLTEKKGMNCNSFNSGLMTDYDKIKYFGRTDLRDEYSAPSNNRVEIRKKVCRGSYTPKGIRNKFSLQNEEDFLENFQYYEINNIKDKYNKKYESITRVTGYSNLVPVSNRKIEYNVNNLKHNFSNIDIYKNTNIKRHFDIEQKPKKEEKITKVEIKKKYEVQQKPPQTAIKSTTTQSQTSKRKYESTQLPKNTTKTTNIQIQKKYEAIKKPETTSKTTVTTTTQRKFESAKPQTVTKTTNKTNIQTQNVTKKYEVQKKEVSSKTAKSQSKPFKYVKKEIDMSKYNRDTSSKLVFKKGGGRYKYKENIEEKDIINSRKNDTQNKNTQKVTIVETNTKKDTKKVSLANTSSVKTSNTNKTTITKKVEQTAKNTTNTVNKNINKTNNVSTSRNLKETKLTSAKSTSNIKSSTNKFVSKQVENKAVNKPATNSFKTNITTKINIQKVSTNLNNKKTTPVANLPNITKKNYETNIKLNTQKKEEIDINKYRKDIINMEEQRKKIAKQQYLTNIDSSAKIYDSINNISNVGYIENREMNERYEMKQCKRKELTPKTKTKILGDNYKYYESKCIQNPGEIVSTNSYTLHQRRNERVIYGEVYEGYEDMKAKGYKSKSGKKHKKHKKMMQRRMIPFEGGEGNYAFYNKYYQDYNYTGGRGCEEFEYENDEKFNNYPQGMIYYP